MKRCNKVQCVKLFKLYLKITYGKIYLGRHVGNFEYGLYVKVLGK